MVQHRHHPRPSSPSVPLHRQKEVGGYLDYLYKKRGELIGWLRTLENRDHLDSTSFSPRALNIIETTRKFAQKNATNGRDRTKDGKKKGRVVFLNL